MAKQRIGTLAAALWWGSLTALGFVVVPLLFVNLPSPAIAGAMAARLFTAQTWLSVACAVLILMAVNQKDDPEHTHNSLTLVRWVLVGLLLALLVEFGVSPRIANARVEGGNLKLWHGLGSGMYFTQWICAGFSLWILTGRAR